MQNSPSPDQSASSNQLSLSQLTPSQQRDRLKELAAVFLRLGVTAFGGPAAHIAMMDDEVVKRRQWLSREKLLDLLGITNLIPGPNSTELAIHIGYERAGLWGLAIAGVCFILPAMLMVWGLAALYVHYQTVPQLGWLLYGIKPVIVAIVMQALWKLGRTAIKDMPTLLVAIVVAVAFLAGMNEITLLVLAGLVLLLAQFWQRPASPSASAWIPLVWLAQVEVVPTAIASATAGSIFLTFLKIGSVLYGSGYVLLAFLQEELVERNQWLTSQQLLDAVAIGQFTPGPVFTTATFVGYLAGGNAGALAATVGIFLPSFVLVALVNPLADRLRRSRLMSGFLDGVNAASLGLMAVVTYTLARTAVIDWLTLLLAIGAVILVFRTKINSVWLILIGGAIGLIWKLVAAF